MPENPYLEIEDLPISTEEPERVNPYLLARENPYLEAAEVPILERGIEPTLFQRGKEMVTDFFRKEPGLGPLTEEDYAVFKPADVSIPEEPVAEPITPDISISDIEGQLPPVPPLEPIDPTLAITDLTLEETAGRRTEINERLRQLDTELQESAKVVPEAFKTTTGKLDALQAQLEEITSQAVDGALPPDLYEQYTALRPQHEKAVEDYNAAVNTFNLTEKTRVNAHNTKITEAQKLTGELEDLKQMEYGIGMTRPISAITGKPIPTPEEVAASGRAAMAIIPYGFASAVRGVVLPALERAVMDPLTKAIVGKEYVSPIDGALKIGEYLPEEARAAIGVLAHMAGAIVPLGVSFKTANAMMKAAGLPADLVLRTGPVMDRIAGHVARGGLAGAVYGGLEAGTPKGMAEDAAFFGALEGGLGAVGGIFRKIFSANWYRNLEVKERGLVVQSLDDMLNRGYSEGEILRQWDNPAWRAEALARRMEVEPVTRLTAKDITKEAIREELIKRPEAPVAAVPEKPIPTVPPAEIVPEVPPISVEELQPEMGDDLAINAIERIGNAQVRLNENNIRRAAIKFAEGNRVKELKIRKELRKTALINRKSAMNDLYESLEPEFKLGDVVEVELSGIQKKTKVKIEGAYFDISQSIDQLKRTGFPASFKLENLIGKNVVSGEKIEIYPDYNINGKKLFTTIKKDPEKILKQYIASKITPGIPPITPEPIPELPPVPEELAIERKPILSTYGTPWKTEARASLALRSKRLKDMGITEETHEVVPVEDGFGVVEKIEEVIEPEVMPEIEKEFVEIAEEPKVVPEPEKPIIEAPLVKEEIPIEPIKPEAIIIPEFKNTEEALAFGKTATSEQIEVLKVKRDESLSKSDVLKAKGDLQGAMDEATRGQFFREAIESAEKKLVVEKFPAVEIPKERQIYKMTSAEAVKYENTELFLSPELEQLHNHRARVLGFEKAGGSFVEGYLTKLAEVAEKTDMSAAMATYKALSAYKKGNIEQATLDAEKILGKLHEEEVKVLTHDRIIELHKQDIRKALKSGKLTSEKYAELHEKDYGSLAEFMPEMVEKPKVEVVPEPVLKEPEAKYLIAEFTEKYRQSELDLAFGGKKKVDEAIESVAKEVDSVSRRGMPDRVARKPAKSKVAEEMRKSKRVDLTGRKLTTGNESQEIAELFQVYRSPKTEILHAIYTSKDGVILGHNALTSGNMGAVGPTNAAKYIYRIQSAAKRLGATKVHILHNHPSGNPTMSQHDVNFANALHRQPIPKRNALGDLMGEFIVIDHGKFTWVSDYAKNGYIHVLEGVFEVTPGTGEWMLKKGPQMTGPKAVAAFGQNLAYDKSKACFVYVDGGNNIQGWSTHDKKILEKSVPELEKILRQQTKAHDSSKAVILADDMTLLEPIARYGNVGDWLLDALDIKGNSLREIVPAGFKVIGKPTKPAWGLFEPEISYAEEPITEVKSRLLENIKSEKGSSELINDLSRLGADAMRRGHTTYKAFTAEMKTELSSVWEKIKSLIRKAYFAAKKILKSERGAVEISKPGPKLKDIIRESSKEVAKIVGSSKPKDILAYYQKKYPGLSGVTLGGLKSTKKSGKLIDAGVAKVILDDTGKFIPEESSIHFTKDATPITVRHEIEHLLDVLHGRDPRKFPTQTMGRFTHDKFAEEWLAKKREKTKAATTEENLIDRVPERPWLTKSQKERRAKKKAIKEKQLKIENAKEAKEQIHGMIRDRRQNLNLSAYETNLFVNDIEQQTTKTQREIIPFIIEKTDIPESLNRPDLEKTYKKDKDNLAPIALQVKQHFDAGWLKMKENIPDMSAEQIENYVTHIWDLNKGQKRIVTNWFTTQNRFLKKRYIETLREGIEELGLTPKVLDISEIIRIHDGVASRAIENTKFVEGLKGLKYEGMPLIERADKAPQNWVYFDHPALRRGLVIPGKLKMGEKVSPELSNLLAEMGVAIGRRISPVAFGKPVGKAGEYISGEPPEIRFQRFMSSRTIAHEIGHHLDEVLGLGYKFLNNYASELYEINRERIESRIGEISKYGEAYARSTEEQIAEFFATLFTDASKAYRIAPNATADALNRLRQDEVLSKLIDFDFEKQAKNLIEEQLNTLVKLPVKVHPDLEKPLKVVFESRIEHPAIQTYEVTNGVLKKTNLSLSLFHHGALGETGIAIMGLRKVLNIYFNPVKIYKAMAQGKFDVFEKEPIARRWIGSGLQVGATADVPINMIQSKLNNLARKTKNVPLINKTTEFIRTFNEVWDKALWNYLHDTLKLYACESLGTKIDPTKDMTKQEQEITQFVNDTFGGQNWDTLMISPKSLQIMTWSLLSADWTTSTVRQALSPTGIGRAHKETIGMRRKLGAYFWIKAGLYFGVGINLLNYTFREWDEKENPKYYEGMGKRTILDKTMAGNTMGHKTHLFVGRYEDGTERYIRWGKQFRELPELFFDDTGFNPISATLKKVGGKLAPMVQLTSKIFTGTSPSGFRDDDIYGKKGWDRVYGIGKTLIKSPLPFATRALFQEGKKFHLTDLAMPSSKGMTRWKSINLFKHAIIKRDDQLLKETYQFTLMNNLPAYTLFSTALTILKAESTKEFTEGIKTIEDVKKLLDKVDDPKDLIRLGNKYKRIQKENVDRKIGMDLLDQAILDIKKYELIESE